MTGEVWAVVVAAGRGERFSASENKLMHRIDGKPVLLRCLEALEASGALSGIVLVTRGEMTPPTPLVRRVVQGGASRQESVYNGLMALPENVDIVAIHDAARPFIAPEVVCEAIRLAGECGSGVPSTLVTDTIKRLNADGWAVETPARDSLRAVQTPQTFRREEICRAHEAARRDGYSATDDAALYERYIGPVRVFHLPQCEENIKVTTKRDVEKRMPRIGSGFDAHRLTEDRKLILCGVEIPHDRGLLGHSDADVAVHALMDALLGAAALGDIGRHFPDSDMRYKGISSLELLAHVSGLLAEKGYEVGNVDVTIVAQKPKVKPYIEQMRENLARTMGLAVEKVSVKATTTEKMGYEGREEGISAQAVALIY